MIPQRVWISGGLLVAVIAGILVYELALEPGAEKRKGEALRAYLGFKPEQVKRIELSRPGKSNILVKPDKTWLVENEGNFPADPEGVEKLLEAVKNLTCNQEVSNSEKELERFELTTDKALEVKLMGDKALLAHFYIGKRGTTYDSSYYRKADSNQVCLTYKNLLSLFDRTDDTWKDKSILSFDATACKALELQDGNTTYLLVKDLKENKWQMQIGNERKPAQLWVVDGICQTLSRLKTQGFPSVTIAEAGLDKPKKKIKVSLVGDKNYTLLFGNKLKDKSDYYVQVLDKNIIYQLSEWQVNSLFKNQNELLAKESSAQENPPSSSTEE